MIRFVFFWTFPGDLFDVLLPMLNIYQEFVRNHHFSLQILTECKQNPQFSSVLTRLEEHSACQGRSLETFLTYPMHQVMDSYVIDIRWILEEFKPKMTSSDQKIKQNKTKRNMVTFWALINPKHSMIDQKILI